MSFFRSQYMLKNQMMNGALSIDTSAQLKGKPSMMNHKREQISPMPEMDMPGSPKFEIKNLKPSTLEHACFSVSGNCGMCKTRIEKAAKSVKGVSLVFWDVKTKKIQVEYNITLSNPDGIQKAIAKAGHETGKYKADDKVYNSLPECCVYRK